MTGDGFRDAARYCDELGPDYPEAHVALVDALRAYLRCCDAMRDDLLREGSITPEQALDDDITRYCRLVLQDLEKHEFDPSLCGMRKVTP